MRWGSLQMGEVTKEKEAWLYPLQEITERFIYTHIGVYAFDVSILFRKPHCKFLILEPRQWS